MTVFTWLNKQGVKSDTGFSVQFTGRFTCEYSEGKRTLKFEVENGYDKGKPCTVTRRTSFFLWDGEKLTLERQQEIINNIEAAMDFQGLKLIVD